MEGHLIAQSTSQRAFFREISSLAGMIVQVSTSYGQSYIGTFKGFDPSSLSVCLSDAKDEQQKMQDLVFIMGQHIQQIVLAEKPFDLEGLQTEIGRLFPKGEVKLDHDARVILVLNKVKVTENGVEGTGPIAERVQKIFESYIEELEASKQEKSE
jgi:small nuclear ribonucleoprotein (snRNP)-like protein